MKFDKVAALALLREATGNGVEQTAHHVAQALTASDIPHLFVGGYAVQENGYPRMTVDVDVVVPDIDIARDCLSMRGFQEVQGTRTILKDRQTKVTVDLMPAGGSVGPHILPLPVPSKVNSSPIVIPLNGLIEQKLSSYLANKISRARDLGDVVELIKYNQPPRDLELNPQVRDEYLRLWDGLNSVRS